MDVLDKILCGALILASITLMLMPLWLVGLGVYNILFGDPAAWFFIPIGFLLGGAVALLAMTLREYPAPREEEGK